ncbi:c-type cytochrome [Alcaligenaceae bacterium CGII-47]|nr:c-type cytochrome [Alcaligenaceae bacterium CGII-47]
MSCINGTDCKEPAKRHLALGILGLMTVIFIVLSIWSFMGPRVQAIPTEVHFGPYDAVQGKRVFQAYNCMGCHTIVGNGAYFGPDLTKTYEHVGPAWLAAFLPSAGGWPTSAAVQAQLQNAMVSAEPATTDMAAYEAQYPGAAERIRRRGGHASLMPNLPFTADEIGGLIAFLKYTSAMHNEGWPPKPKVDGLDFVQASAGTQTVSMNTASAGSTEAAPKAIDPVALGAKLVQDMGCLACHAKDQKRIIGPGWEGMVGSDTTLADGSTVKVDEAYLIEAIRHPDAQVVAGYPAGVMPSYDAMINEQDMAAIVAYLSSLKGAAK